MPACLIDQHRPATDGHLCAVHFVALSRLLDPDCIGTPPEQLRENPERVLPSIPVLYRELDPQYARRELGSQALSSVFGSRPPGNLQVLALRDPRSRVDGAGPDDHEPNPPLAVFTQLWTIVARVDRTDIDGHLEARPSRTVEAASAWLYARRDWLAAQTWIDHAFGLLRALHAQLRGAWGDPATSPVGTCIQLVDDHGHLQADGPWRCAWPLYLPDQTPRAMDEPIQLPSLRCSSCGWTYHGPELVRLGRERWEQARAKEIA